MEGVRFVHFGGDGDEFGAKVGVQFGRPADLPAQRGDLVERLEVRVDGLLGDDHVATVDPHAAARSDPEEHGVLHVSVVHELDDLNLELVVRLKSYAKFWLKF